MGDLMSPVCASRRPVAPGIKPPEATPQVPGSLTITSPPLSIARELWRLGEPDLAARAVNLSAEQAVDIAIRAGDRHQSGEALSVWPDGPSGTTSARVLAAVEYLEGSLHPCARSRRLPEKSLPPALQATEQELWAALAPVAQVLDRRRLETRG